MLSKVIRVDIATHTVVTWRETCFNTRSTVEAWRKLAVWARLYIETREVISKLIISVAISDYMYLEE